MSSVIPPIIPMPGEGGDEPDSAPDGTATPSEPGDLGQPANPEEEVIRERDREHRRREDLVDVLTADHQTIQELFSEVGDPGVPARRRQDVTEVLVAELSRQVVIERRYLVPLVRDNLTDRGADRLLAELAELEEAVPRLHERPEAPGPGAPAPGGQTELGRRFERLAADREQRLFPELRAACSQQRLREAGQRARAARGTAPTRPHPHTPDRPPWSTVTDPVVGAADKVRDEVTGRPTEPRDLG